MSETWKVRMMRSTKGSPDGTRVNDYQKGQVYDLPAGLGRAFVEDLKCAKRVDRSKPKRTGPTPETKALGAAPENKGAKRRRGQRVKENPDG